MLEVGLFLVLLAAILLAIGWSKRTVPTAGTIQGPQEFACEVVGESYYQDHLEQIAGGRRSQSAETRRQAVLYLDDDNEHDRNAVAVYIEGLRVGHLSRELAGEYREQLKRKKIPTANLKCDAMIVGGWDRGGDDRGHFGVRLDLPVVD